eukprot:366522-Chlamydomonas_euryale.AAC.22
MQKWCPAGTNKPQQQAGVRGVATSSCRTDSQRISLRHCALATSSPPTVRTQSSTAVPAALATTAVFPASRPDCSRRWPSWDPAGRVVRPITDQRMRPLSADAENPRASLCYPNPTLDSGRNPPERRIAGEKRLAAGGTCIQHHGHAWYRTHG